MAQQSEYRKPSGRPPMRLGSLMIRVALILLCLVMISIHLMGGMYARYSTKASSSDDARVAKFDVKVNGSGDVIVDCKQGDNGTFEITVNNASEVAVSYQISVSHDAMAGVISSFNSDSGTLAAGTSTTDNEHVLTFEVDWSQFTADKNGEYCEVPLDFTVTIDVVQVD